MILLLGTLVLLVFKVIPLLLEYSQMWCKNLRVDGTMGQLQEVTALNGTAFVLTWNIRMPIGKSFLAFKVFEGSSKIEFATIKKESTVINNPDRLKGRVFTDSKSNFDTVPMVFRLKIDPITIEDDGLIISYVVIDTDIGTSLAGEDSIKVTTIPYYCDSRVQLNEKYSLQSDTDLNLSITVCGNPMPTVEWKFPSWVFNSVSQLTTKNITENSKSKYVYNVLLENVDLRNCGKKIYFNASNENSYLTGNTTVNIKGTPTKITGITASEINGVNKCVRVSFSKVDVGLCDISYLVRFLLLNTTELLFPTICTMLEVCDSHLVDSTVNVAALFNDNLGPYNEVNVTITKDNPSIIVATKVQVKYGSKAVVGSFFGGVLLTILIGCAILFAYRRFAVKSQEKNFKTINTDNKEVDNGNYTALNTTQPQRGDYAVPSNYTEVADMEAKKQSIYINSE